MHILFLTDNFPPEVNAPASRTHEHCRRWVASGVRVTVITCAPNFPKGRVFDGYRNRLWQEEVVEGIRVIRVWSYITANEGFLRRILDYVSFMASSFLANFLVRDIDVVVGTSPQFFTAVSGWAVGASRRVPFVFELRDIWPESIKAVGAMKDSLAIRWLERLEMFLYRRAARVISVTHSFKDTLVRRGIDGSKIDVITNGVDLGRFSPRPRDADLEERLALKDCFVVGYVGTHGLAHGLDTLLRTMARLQARDAAADVRLLLLGDGAMKEQLKQQAVDLKLTNVLFVDTVPKDEVSRYWSLLDASIIHLKRTELFSTVIPSKLFECMGMGLPVLHGVAGESARIVEDEGVGLVFEPENDEQLADQMMRLKDDHALRKSLATAGVAAAKKYDRLYLADAMLGHLRSTVGGVDGSGAPATDPRAKA